MQSVGRSLAALRVMGGTQGLVAQTVRRGIQAEAELRFMVVRVLVPVVLVAVAVLGPAAVLEQVGTSFLIR
jgi:uncharacterized membrane protein (UPF0136 family)